MKWLQQKNETREKKIRNNKTIYAEGKYIYFICILDSEDRIELANTTHATQIRLLAEHN